MIELYLIRYFLAVVETGNFTKAAEKVFVSQPTLSAGIKKLEAQLGQQLFERGKRRVFLTEAGTRLLPRAKAIMHECNMAVQDMEEASKTPVIRLGLLMTLSSRIVSNILQKARAAMPSVSFELVDGTEQELNNRLDDRSIDFALSINRGDHEEWGVTKLFSEGYSLCVSADHWAAGKKQMSGEQFGDQNMIVRSRCEVLSETSRYFTDRNVRPRLTYRTTNDERALRMVEAGIGAALVPDSYLRDGFAALKLKGFDYTREVALLHPRYTMPASTLEHAERFIECMG